MIKARIYQQIKLFMKKEDQEEMNKKDETEDIIKSS
jgi:hypothetical protein